MLWKRQEGVNHRASSFELEYIVKFTDTLTSLQDHSLLYATAVSQIFQAFAFKSAFKAALFA